MAASRVLDALARRHRLGVPDLISFAARTPCQGCDDAPCQSGRLCVPCRARAYANELGERTDPNLPPAFRGYRYRPDGTYGQDTAEGASR